MNLKQREKTWAELLVSQNDTSQLSSDAKDYLAGLLGKERGEATNSSLVDDKKRVSMGWWPLRLSAKILAVLRLSVNFFQLRLTKKLKINFFCFKKLKY